MNNILKGVLCLVAMVTCVHSCSPLAPGTPEPTLADIVGFAHHVIIGEVTELIRPDPFGDFYGDKSYGAMVTVQCMYKGGILPGRIRIGAAGSIPGMCTTKNLTAGMHYVLFLNGKDTQFDSFEQSAVAVPKTKIKDYLSVCGLLMDYPRENDMMLRREVCPPAEPSTSCNNPGGKQPNPDPINSRPTQSPNENPPKLQGSSTAKSTDVGNMASMVTATSVSAILFSFLCYMML